MIKCAIKNWVNEFSRIVRVIFIYSLISACTVSIEEYKDTSPSFLLEEFFNGKMIANGMIQNYQDKVTRRFCVELDGQWEIKNDSAVGVLDEVFYFDDGEQQTRVWTIEKPSMATSKYIGTAADVKGKAVGEVQGMAFQWQYTLALEKPRKIDLFVDDWIYLINDNSAINRSELKKWGVTVGSITIHFDRTEGSCGVEDVSGNIASLEATIVD